MDGLSVEHSDSDSGESWTLLENGLGYANEAAEFADEAVPCDERNVPDNAEKDDDTDGISIISDSDRDSATPCDLLEEPNLSVKKDRPTVLQTNPDYLANPLPPNNNEKVQRSIRCDNDFLGDNTKLKTYVHKRNKRLSTVLNIIMLGSVITAAGVAIGHMWGVRDDCVIQNPPSVNKILSNLYKLQEENTYLRSKLKELTLANNVQLKKQESVKIGKYHKCKKVFEESLNSKTGKGTKCVDDQINKNIDIPESHLIEPDFENDYLKDINKLKNIYKQNRSWIDGEIAKRMKIEDKLSKKYKNNIKLSEKNCKVIGNYENKIDNRDSLTDESNKKPEFTEHSQKKISYADSLKADVPEPEVVRIKRSNESKEDKARVHTYKQKSKKEPNYLPVGVSSMEELETKDNRYTFSKRKPEWKKNDRQKSHNKQKRRNKYEQWEMKGGYMKDYDDLSVNSMQENELSKNSDKNLMSREFERQNYIDQFIDTDNKETKNDKMKTEKIEKNDNKSKEKKRKGEDNSWYDKRAAFRNEARHKLELELFGERGLNNAAWYFRRMRKREQCRAKGDNSTHKKIFAKRDMNYKIRH